MNRILGRICFYAIFLLTAAAQFLVTLVVILLVLSTLNIVNSNVLHIEKLYYLEITAAAAISIISGVIFFRSLGKISRFIKNAFFRDILP
ncbi:MAG TPA: hypothetical protein ENH01_06735 [Nitrospirae bacterium]|nr:hypothetical protein [Nitrospirota bacterium]